MADIEVLDVDGREVTVTHPDKVVFPELNFTKLDLVRYYLAVADGALRGVEGRPMILKRFVKGIDEEAFFQKRAPTKRPEWIEVAELKYASGRSAEEVVIRDAAALAWTVNLGCVDLNPHPTQAEDLLHPDELRIDLDPMAGVGWGQITEVAQVAKEVLEEHGLRAWAKTSGSRGLHIYTRIRPAWDYKQTRLAAETVAREVEIRVPDLATSKWWKEERGSQVFVDFNQMAYDRTVASAYSVRANHQARVSTPLTWDELPGSRQEDFTVLTVPERFAERGDPWADLDAYEGDLDRLLARAKELGPAEKPPRRQRQAALPLIEVTRTKTKPEALADLETWKARHPQTAARLEPTDVLVDGMRGRSSIWYRIRVNLQHVPEAERPPQEPLEHDYNPWAGFIDAAAEGRRPAGEE